MVTKLKREFVVKGNGGKDIVLSDPNPEFSPDEVLKHYMSAYPSLNNANVTGPDVKTNKLVYNMQTSVGTKG